MNNICVVGAAGYIGSKLCRDLLALGYNVLAADNLYKGGDSLIELVSNNLFRFQYCDITIEDDVKKLLNNDIDTIILLSGIVGLPECKQNPVLAWAVNVDGWMNVLKYKGDAKVVAASTGSVYGAIKDGLCTEDSRTNPKSLYGITKLGGEKAVLDSGGIALRFATCAGVSPNMRLNLLPNQLVYEAITNRSLTIFEADNMRTFIDIRDFSRSLIHFMEQFDNLKYRIYNIGDEKNNWSKRQLANYISEKTGCFVNYNETFKDADARDYVVEYSRAKSENFECLYSMEEMVDSLIKSVPLISIRHQYI